MRPSIRQLEYIVAVADEKSFSKAAKRCFVSQPSLSSQVRQIELRLGVEIFERAPRGTLVTPIGEAIVAEAQRALEACDALLQCTQESRGPLGGPLHLGSVSTITPYLLPGAIRELRERFPDLELEIYDGTGDELKARLEVGELDLLLTPLPTGLGAVEEVELAHDPFVIAAPIDSPLADLPEPLSLEALEGTELILLEDPHCLREHALDLCQRAHAKPLEAFHAASLSTVIQLVRRGLGISLLPSTAIEVELAGVPDVRLMRLAAPSPGRLIGLAWRKGSPRRDEFELLASFLMGHAEACSRWESSED